MKVSITASLDVERAQYAIGRVSARSGWRAAERPLDEADRESALKALMREAEEYGADGVVELAYTAEDCAAEGVRLHRVVATGRAVRLALAA